MAISLVVNNGGLFERARQVAFIQDMTSYQEETKLIALNGNIEKYASSQTTGESNISVGLEGQESIETIHKKIKSEYKATGKTPSQVIIQNSVMYYNYNGTKKSKERVKWCFDANIPVWGYSTYEEFLNDVGQGEPAEDVELGDKTNPISKYTKVGSTYANSPDLSNFNAQATYYITYDQDVNNPKIAGRIDRIDPPKDWYDYGAKKWANVVTVSGSEVAYWVWTPRYAYKADSNTQTVDAKFIDINNNGKDSNDKAVDITDYKISDAFSFNEKTLPGYWISKYEISDKLVENIGIEPKDGALEITTDSTADSTYNIYISGKLTVQNIKLPYTLSNLEVDKNYDICIMNGTDPIYSGTVKTKDFYIDLIRMLHIM